LTLGAPPVAGSDTGLAATVGFRGSAACGFPTARCAGLSNLGFGCPVVFFTAPPDDVCDAGGGGNRITITAEPDCRTVDSMDICLATGAGGRFSGFVLSI
jgi:hypothetical protein